MITDIWLFSLFLLITGALIFILVFFIITLSGTPLTTWILSPYSGLLFSYFQTWSVTISMLKNAVVVSTSGTSPSSGSSWSSPSCFSSPATGSWSSSTSRSPCGSSGSSTSCRGETWVRKLHFSVKRNF